MTAFSTQLLLDLRGIFLHNQHNCGIPIFRFAYANGGDESLPPAQCKIKKDISVLLYPTTLITKFIPAFFTEGQQQQGLKISQTTNGNLTVASGISASISRNQVRLSIHVGKKMSHLNNIFIEISILVSKLAQHTMDI